MTKQNIAPVFESGQAFRFFESDVRRHSRYIRSATTERFLKAVKTTCAERILEIPLGKIFWRAQLGNDWRPAPEIEADCKISYPYPFSPERMKPLLDRATEGRVSPKGIPCLYLATTERAAISEVRPWIGSYVSIGQFRVGRNIRVVDCSKYHDEFPIHFLDEPPIELRDYSVWIDIDRAFAKPITRGDDTGDYIPTQILAELFRSNGADGVMYKSAFGDDAFNVALFDLNAADLIECRLASVSAIEFASVDLGASYNSKPSE